MSAGRRFFLQLLCCQLVLAFAAPAAALEPAAVPGGSLYGMPIEFVDQAATRGRLDRFRGSPVIVSLFYASCAEACPLLISGIQQIEGRLSPHRRARLRVLLVTLDPVHDTPAELAKAAALHRVDLSRWTLARVDAPALKELARALGIEIRRRPDSQFDHSPVLTLLDAQGRPVRNTQRLLKRDPDFEADLVTALDSAR